MAFAFAHFLQLELLPFRPNSRRHYFFRSVDSFEHKLDVVSVSKVEFFSRHFLNVPFSGLRGFAPGSGQPNHLTQLFASKECVDGSTPSSKKRRNYFCREVEQA